MKLINGKWSLSVIGEKMLFGQVHDYLVRAIPVKHRKRAEEGRKAAEQKMKLINGK